jgi:type IV secretory pathway TrbD component
MAGDWPPLHSSQTLGAMFLMLCLFFPDRGLEIAKGVLAVATLAAFLFAVAAAFGLTVQLVAELYIAMDGAYWMTYWFFPLVCYTDEQVVPCEF